MSFRKEELKSHSSNEDEYHDPADTAPKHTFIGDGEVSIHGASG